MITSIMRGGQSSIKCRNSLDADLIAITGDVVDGRAGHLSPHNARRWPKLSHGMAHLLSPVTMSIIRRYFRRD